MKGGTAILLLHKRNQYRKSLPKLSALNTYKHNIILELSSMLISLFFTSQITSKSYLSEEILK